MDKQASLVMKLVTATVLIFAVIIGVYYGTSYFSEANKIAEIIERGSMYMEAMDYDNAIVYYNEALDYEPESVNIRNAISYAYIKKACAMHKPQFFLIY